MALKIIIFYALAILKLKPAFPVPSWMIFNHRVNKQLNTFWLISAVMHILLKHMDEKNLLRSCPMAMLLTLLQTINHSFIQSLIFISFCYPPSAILAFEAIGQNFWEWENWYPFSVNSFLFYFLSMKTTPSHSWSQHAWR